MNSDYVPDAGDIVWLSFDPQAGHEQAGHRRTAAGSSTMRPLAATRTAKVVSGTVHYSVWRQASHSTSTVMPQVVWH